MSCLSTEEAETLFKTTFALFIDELAVFVKF